LNGGTKFSAIMAHPLNFGRRSRRSALGMLGAAAAAVAAPFTRTARAAAAIAEPDMILHNGKIVTVDKQFSIAQAVAIKGNTIIAVGSNATIAGLASPATQTIDLKGATVIPGLRDSHLHALSIARDIFNVALEDARTLAAVNAALAKRVAETKPGDWVIASSGWHEGQIAEGRMPTRQELDAISPQNPVFIPRGGHVAVVNSAALKLAGITKDTVDPKGGVIVRDAHGEPTGFLIESPAMNMVRKLLPPVTKARLIEGLEKSGTMLAALGITATTEPGATPDDIAAYMDLWQHKALKQRVRIMQWGFTLNDVKARSSVLAPNFGDDWLRIGGFKTLFDGGIEGAYMYDKYNVVEGEQTDPNFHGKLLLPPGGEDEALAMFMLAADRGWQYQVHAVGDATVDKLVGLYEKVAEKYPIGSMRWAILHAMSATPAALDRIKKLGVRVTVQDQSVRLANNMLRYWGEPRAGYCTPVKSIISRGIPTGGGTDAPVAHWNPYVSLWWMVTRKVEIKGKITGPLGPGERISREDALRLYTIGSADVDFVDERLGSIEPGKLADLAVLSGDYLTVPEDHIRDLTCTMTIVDGAVVHRA
jgi:predicted amidohydrolase YtcJ